MHFCFQRPNFLILDEPTNDVDLDTLRALEGYLDDFKGVLVILSHDRSFTDKVGGGFWHVTFTSIVFN